MDELTQLFPTNLDFDSPCSSFYLYHVIGLICLIHNANVYITYFSIIVPKFNGSASIYYSIPAKTDDIAKDELKLFIIAQHTYM